MSKLIVIHGPSAAGKSTVTEKLFNAITEPVAIIDLDHYRFMFKSDKGARDLDEELAKHNMITCLNNGFNVIFDGGFDTKNYKELFREVITSDIHEIYFFYLNVSLNETFRRHAKKQYKIIDEDKMAELYDRFLPTEHPNETVIEESSSLDGTVSKIIEVTKLNTKK